MAASGLYISGYLSKNVFALNNRNAKHLLFFCFVEYFRKQVMQLACQHYPIDM